MKQKAISKLSSKTLALWETLNPSERKKIQKDYPFPNDRNTLIVQLRDKGATTTALAEIVGISQTAICNIIKKTKKKRVKKEIVPIVNVDFQPVLMLLINDFLREKYASAFDSIKFYPEDYQQRAIHRFLLIKTYQDYFIKANQLVLGDEFLTKPVTIDFCNKNKVPLNTFYRWLKLYRQSGIEGLVPKYISQGNKIIEVPLEKKPRSKKKS